MLAGAKNIILMLFLIAVFLSCVSSPRYMTGTYAGKGQSAESVSRSHAAATSSSRNWYGYEETGIASFTADEQEGDQTASGEIYHMRDLVAAHRSLPFGTIVRVTNLQNNKSVQVRIIDRGPYIKGRIIDLSFEAAKELDFIEQGTTRVKIQVIRTPRN